MARSVTYNPGSIQARSSWLAGLTEVCNKMSGVLDMKTVTETITLSELYISSTDRYRIYEAPIGRKLWLESPTPVIRKNGVRIYESSDGFEIDCLGGSVVFDSRHLCKSSDTITAQVTRITDGSFELNRLYSYVDTSIQDAIYKSWSASY